jgi:hypothetical protein
MQGAAVYQLEVKKWLEFHKFRTESGWEVTIDIDAMERGQGAQQAPDRRGVASQCESWLRERGVRIVAHPVYGSAELVSVRPGSGTFVIEAEADSSKQKEQAMYSALGQLVLSMHDPLPDITHELAVPGDEKWAIQLRKAPEAIRQLLRLQLWLVSEEGVRSL